MTVTAISSNGWGKISNGWICLQYATRITSGSSSVSMGVARIGNGWDNTTGNWIYYEDGCQKFSSNDMHAAWSAISGKSSGTGYYVCISKSACMVYIFKGSAGNWKPYKAMTCSCGKSSTPTPSGTFTVTDRGSYFNGATGHNYTCYYWVRWNGGYLFHTILYNKGTKTVLDGTLGSHVSNGCVRLSWDNAAWIYNNIGYGTKVYSY